LRFWSLVLAHGGRDIQIQTGQSPLRIGLTPASGLLGFGILGDSINYDRPMTAEIEDDLAVPALGQLSLFGEVSDIPTEETEEESE